MKKTQTWIIELEISKHFLRYHHQEIRNAIENFEANLTRIGAKSYYKKPIKIRRYLK